MSEDQSKKKDAGKPRVDLIDADAIEGLARVLGFGAQKYAANGWREGMAWSRLIAALLRHTFAIMRGHDIDPESGLPHIDHLGCCWMFLSAYQKQKLGTDDRYKRPSVEDEVRGYLAAARPLPVPHAVLPGYDANGSPHD